MSSEEKQKFAGPPESVKAFWLRFLSGALQHNEIDAIQSARKAWLAIECELDACEQIADYVRQTQKERDASISERKLYLWSLSLLENILASLQEAGKAWNEAARKVRFCNVVLQMMEMSDESVIAMCYAQYHRIASMQQLISYWRLSASRAEISRIGVEDVRFL